jgi:lipocalin
MIGLKYLTSAFLVTFAFATQCPPTGFNTQGALEGGFDLKWYASAKWYTQAQMVISYLPEDYFRCVTAEYTLLDKSTLLGYNVKVSNHAENKDGKALGPLTELCAKVVNETAGKLDVSPCFLPTPLAGPYWIEAFDQEAGWALVSGGPPTKEGSTGCKTGTGTNNSGLWIFTRNPKRDEALMHKIKGIAEAKGFDVSVLKDTDQTNCASSGSTVQLI